MEPIYLDHNATTPVRAEVVEAMARCWREAPANPASQHRWGQAARRRLEQLREGIATLLGANPTGTPPDRVLFTSGGTEANNLAIRGIAQARSPQEPAQLVISAIEHPSVLEPAEALLEQGWRLDCLGVDTTGVVRTTELPNLLSQQTALVSVMLANHDTGVVQPVAEVARLCRERGVPLHSDAVQAAGKWPIGFRELGVSALSIAAHKFRGPLGIGALIVRGDLTLKPTLFGGSQQWGLRPGTESLPLVVGMYTALELWQQEQQELAERMIRLRGQFERGLARSLEGIVIHGEAAPRLPQTSNVAFLGVDAQIVLMALDLAGIACSLGAACSSGSAEPSPTLLAMGLPRATVDSSLRFSLGATTTPAEIDEAVRRIVSVVGQLRGKRIGAT